MNADKNTGEAVESFLDSMLERGGKVLAEAEELDDRGNVERKDEGHDSAQEGDEDGNEIAEDGADESNDGPEKDANNSAAIRR